MPHSLRAKLSGLRYKGILEDKDYKRLCHALDLEKAEQEPTDKNGNYIYPSDIVLDKPNTATSCVPTCGECCKILFERSFEQEPCEKCLYAEETDGSHCYECVKGESKFEPKESEDKE